MTFRRFLRTVVPGVVAFVTGEPEVLDPAGTAERLWREADVHHAVKGSMWPPPGRRWSELAGPFWHEALEPMIGGTPGADINGQIP